MRIMLLALSILASGGALADSCVDLVRFTTCPPSDDATASYSAQWVVECREEPADFRTTTTVLFRKPGYRGYETLNQSSSWFFGMPRATYWLFQWNFMQPGIYVFEAEAKPACPDGWCVDPPCNRDQCEVSWRVADITANVTLQNYTFTGAVTLRIELRDPVSGE